MPRLKAIHAQKLYRLEAGQPDAYPNLQLVLTKPIDWELVRQQYDQMDKYTTALRLGTEETEAILRRFTRSNVQHPTYKAFGELGKAVKTIFLCRSPQLSVAPRGKSSVVSLWLPNRLKRIGMRSMMANAGGIGQSCHPSDHKERSHTFVWRACNVQ